MEIWKHMPGYKDKYQVSTLGNIRSLKSGRRSNKEKILKPQNNGLGYMQIKLPQTVKKMYYVHRLVMLTFKGNSVLEVNHKNGIKSDNRLCNLEYCTKSENHKHRFSVLRHTPPMKGKFGTLHPNVQKINQYTQEGAFIKTWDYIRQIQIKTGIKESNICMCCKGKLKTAGGYKWQYVNINQNL